MSSGGTGTGMPNLVLEGRAGPVEMRGPGLRAPQACLLKVSRLTDSPLITAFCHATLTLCQAQSKLLGLGLEKLCRRPQSRDRKGSADLFMVAFSKSSAVSHHIGFTPPTHISGVSHRPRRISALKKSVKEATLGRCIARRSLSSYGTIAAWLEKDTNPPTISSLLS